jgi:hypothetical protein
MPTHLRDDDTPVVYFNAELEVSPFALFRRFQEDRIPDLYDVRPDRGRRTLRDSKPYPGKDWTPDAPDAEVILFDDDGSLAVPMAARLREIGYTGVRALFGGLDLYVFSLDPQVVGEETYLEELSE